MPFRKTPFKPEERREKAAWGGLSFGYFSLAVQRKVSRLPVREPALNQASQRETIKTIGNKNNEAFIPRGHEIVPTLPGWTNKLRY